MRQPGCFFKRHWQGAAGAAIGVFFLIATPLSFINGAVLQKTLEAVLHLRIDPSYSGGEVMAVFRDRARDDVGAGTLEYPLADEFQNGHALDLIKYTVHEPVVDSRNGGFANADRGSYWQVDVLMADRGPACVHLYIDTGGGALGSTQSATSRSELVRFDPAHPWDLFVEIDFKDARAFVENVSKTIHRPLTVFSFSERRGLAVRLPLDIPEVQRVLDGRSTWHYVLVGAYDDYAPGHFMKTQANASLHAGGGSVSSLEPRVYDCLVPRGVNKAKMLSSYDDSSGRLATVEPVEARKGVAPAASDEKRIAALEASAAADAHAANAALLRDIQNKTGLQRAVALFQAGRDAEARAAFTAILATAPEDPRALAYQGALTAKEGGATKNLGAAIRFVNEGFALMDRAVALDQKAGTPFADPLVARGMVAISVPETVFNKSAQGAEDFGAAAAWFEGAGPDFAETCAEMFVDQGIAFERASEAEAAEISFIKAASLDPKKASTILQLVKRGYEE
jgi:tetratricopeptide (TPR) repeat protein